MSIKSPPAILGPEMAAPIFWAPGIFGFFCWKTSIMMPIKFLVSRLRGGIVGFFWKGGGSANFIFMGVRIFPISALRKIAIAETSQRFEPWPSNPCFFFSFRFPCFFCFPIFLVFLGRLGAPQRVKPLLFFRVGLCFFLPKSKGWRVRENRKVQKRNFAGKALQETNRKKMAEKLQNFFRVRTTQWINILRLSFALRVIYILQGFFWDPLKRTFETSNIWHFQGYFDLTRLFFALQGERQQK